MKVTLLLILGRYSPFYLFVNKRKHLFGTASAPPYDESIGAVGPKIHFNIRFRDGDGDGDMGHVAQPHWMTMLSTGYHTFTSMLGSIKMRLQT